MRHHRALLAIGLVAAAVVVAAAVPAWRLLEEEISLRKLESLSEEERQTAARHLGQIRSSRAVPRLLTLVLAEVRSGDPPWEHYAARALVEIGEPGVEALFAYLVTAEDRSLNLTADILGQFGPAAADGFLKVLRHPREEVRLMAVRALASMDEIAERIAPVLLARLEDPGEARNVRYWAAFDLPGLGAPAEAVLTKALRHADPLVRVYAAHALQETGPRRDAETVPVLTQALESPDPRAREQAIESLSRVERISAEMLGRLLTDPAEEVRSAAVGALTRSAPTAAMLPALIRVLKEQPVDAGAAAEVIAKLGPGGAPAVPALIARLEENMELHEVADALGRIGPAAKEAVPLLLQAFQGGLCAAGEALGRIGPDAAAAAPAIVQTFSSGDFCMADAGLALLRIGPGAIPAVVRALEDSDYEVRGRAMEVLADFGPRARQAVPKLIELLGGEDPNDASGAVKALGRIGPPAASSVPALSKLLATAVRTRDWEGTMEAAEALGRIGGPAKKTAPLLLRACRFENSMTRAHALLALGRLAAGDPTVREVLREGLSTDEALVRGLSALGSLRLGPADDAVQSALASGFGEEPYRLVHAFEGFPEEARQVLPWLLAALRPDELQLCIRAARVLGDLGPEARTAVPVLRDLLDPIRKHAAEGMAIGSYSPAIREYGAEEAVEAIAEALRRIGG